MLTTCHITKCGSHLSFRYLNASIWVYYMVVTARVLKSSNMKYLNSCAALSFDSSLARHKPMWEWNDANHQSAISKFIWKPCQVQFFMNIVPLLLLVHDWVLWLRVCNWPVAFVLQFKDSSGKLGTKAWVVPVFTNLKSDREIISYSYNGEGKCKREIWKRCFIQILGCMS